MKCTHCGQEIRPTKYGLTKKQGRLLNYLKDYIDQKGVSPSYAEMMSAMELASKSGVHRLVTALHDRGHIRYIPARSRSITLR